MEQVSNINFLLNLRGHVCELVWVEPKGRIRLQNKRQREDSVQVALWHLHLLNSNSKHGFHLFTKTNDIYQLYLREILFTFSFFAINAMAKANNNEYKFKIY